MNTTKKGSLLQNFRKKQLLFTISGLIICILEVSGFELHSSGTEPVVFLGHHSRLGGTILVWGGAQAVIWGVARPRNAPRGAGPDETSDNRSIVDRVK